MEDIKRYNHVDLLFPSQWLKAADFRGKTVTVLIERIDPRADLKRTDGSSEKKPVVYFRGDWKPMVLNRTNGRVLAKLYGPEVTGWIGKPIMLRSEKVSSFGQTVDAIRVVAEKPKPRQSSPRQDEPAHDAETGEVDDAEEALARAAQQQAERRAAELSEEQDAQAEA